MIPGYMVALSLNKPFIIVDKQGVARGPGPRVGKYLIIDDVVTSFNAVNRVRRTLEDMEYLGVAAYIFRGSSVDLKKHNNPVFYLARKEEEV